MFFYIHFQRPPPSTVYAHNPIVFTPQIANDLRTELCPTPYNIYYTWLAPERREIPQKLMTWNPANPFKSVSIPLPPDNPQKSYRLCLHAHISATRAPATDQEVIDLTATSTSLKFPLPVMSLPIHVIPAQSSKKKQGEQKKQENVERILSMNTAGDASLSLVIREHTSYDLDKKVWDSGIGLSAWLVELLDARTSFSPELQILHDLLVANDFASIELGTGTGVVSLVLACLLNSRHTEVAEGRRTLWATDLASAIDVIDQNFAANTPMCEHIDLKSGVLDWEDEDLPESIAKHVEGRDSRKFDLIIMADVTYNTDSFPALVATIHRLLSLNHTTQILLAYKQRDEAERALWSTLKEQGIDFHLIDEIKGAGGVPVEIWLAAVSKSDDIY